MPNTSAIAVCYNSIIVQKTGTELRFKGNIVLDRFVVEDISLPTRWPLLFFFPLSDVSKLCFAATFVNGQSKTMNYLFCKDCNLKCEKD